MPATPGDTVRVHYRGTLSDGTEFDSSLQREPLEFTLGGGEMIPGFDRAVTGMEPGQKIEVTLEPEDAYGQHDDELVFQVDRALMAGEPAVGLHVSVVTPEGPVQAVISDMDDEYCEVDFNHELAGKKLVFEIELLEVEPGDGATAEKTAD